MSVSSNVIVESQYIPDSVGTIYTSSNRKTRIDSVIVTNQDTAYHQFSLHMVPNGGSAGNDNRTIPPRSLQPGEAISVSELVAQSLEPGGFIAVDADAANAVTIRICGITIT